MEPKRLVRALLLAFIGFSLAIMALRIVKQDQRPYPAATTTLTPTAPGTIQQNPFIAYYFYGEPRCVSCKKIEAYTTEAINSGFADELADGKLIFKLVDTDLAENKHFIDEFKLNTKSVVLVEQNGGNITKWENLQEIWTLLGNKDSFIEYVQGQTAGFMGTVK